MHVWRIAARLRAAPAYRGGSGTDADDVRASQLHCCQVRHVRSAALHTLVPSHRRGDAIHVAPHSARFAENRLTLLRRWTLDDSNVQVPSPRYGCSLELIPWLTVQLPRKRATTALPRSHCIDAKVRSRAGLSS